MKANTRRIESFTTFKDSERGATIHDLSDLLQIRIPPFQVPHDGYACPADVPLPRALPHLRSQALCKSFLCISTLAGEAPQAAVARKGCRHTVGSLRRPIPLP